MKNKHILLILAIIAMSFSADAQKTFTKDVASIIYNKCTSCHRPGEIGPFSLQSYDDVVNRAFIIKEVIGTGYMPPWKPDPSYSNFLGEYYLTEDEKQNIIDWIDQGVEYGNSTEEPDLPDFPEGSLLGEPDLVLEMEEVHTHIGDNRDEYRYFVLPTNLPEDKIIKAIELRPGNTKIVHHALFFQDTEGVAASYDAQTPEYGFEGFGGFDVDQVLNYNQYPGYVPGTKPIYYPDGIGQKLEAGADLVIQMHYAPWPIDAQDQSKVNIFFADEDEVIEREVDDRIMLPFDLVSGPLSFFILPNEVKEFHGIWTLGEDRSLIGLSPHMHYLGRSWEVWLEHIDGSRENLISIPDWDFNWQGGYYFKRLIPAEAGAKIHAVAVYDNTLSNPFNPSNPPVFVSWGEGTTDEMYYLPLLTIPYREGDEDVVFEEETTSTLDLHFQPNVLGNIVPNPIHEGLFEVNFALPQGQSITLDLLKSDGSLLRSLRSDEFFSRGNHKVHVSSNGLYSGMYFVRITGKGFTETVKFIKG